MSKVFGFKSEFELIKHQGTRIAVCYGLTAEEDGEHATWHEVYFNTKRTSSPSAAQIKEAIIADINARTDERILSGFEWRDISVWLSMENQFNYKAAYDLAVQSGGASLPVTFKFGTTEEPVYHTFDSLSELSEFYVSAMQYINTQLNLGWQEKDGIDFTVYDDKENKL